MRSATHTTFIAAVIVASLLAGPAAPEARCTQEAGATIPLASGYDLMVPADFTRRHEMWSDTALLYKSYRTLFSIDAGSSSPRQVFHNDRNYALIPSVGGTWSEDGRFLYTWLDPFDQLVRLELDTGHLRPMTDLPTRVWNIEFRQRMDPQPVARASGVLEDPDTGRLLFLVQPWQRSDSRSGAHWLVAAGPRRAQVSRLTPDLPGDALTWDVSRERGELYVLVRNGREAPPTLVMRDLNGHLLDEVSLPARFLTASRMALDPGESRLLIEHSSRPTGYLPDVRSFQGEGVLQPEPGGFSLIDLDTCRIVEEHDAGYLCAWSPDGTAIAYLDDWALKVLDRRTGVHRTLVSRLPSSESGTPGYEKGPVWSADGHRLAVDLGGWYRLGAADHATVLLDLSRREFLVLGNTPGGPLLGKYDMLWSPVPKPFGEGVHEVEDEWLGSFSEWLSVRLDR